MNMGRQCWRFGRAALLVLAVTACEDDTLPPAGESKVSAQEATCVAEGGRWGDAGTANLKICYRPTRDANQACTTSSDCQGFCLARSRTCAPYTPLFGCNDILGDAGAESTVCVQ